MSLDGALLIAAGGLANVNRQMAVISQNIANVNTPDYAREVGTQTSATASGMGLGVLTGPVLRDINAQLQGQVLAQNANVAGLNARSAALGAIDGIQGTPGQGTDLASLLGQLQSAFTSLQSEPSGAAGQAAVVTAAAGLARQINALSDAYAAARQNAQDSIVSDIGTLNENLATLADLTQRIVTARQEGRSTADMENLRDTAKRQTSEMLGVSFITQPNGGLMMATSGGLTISLQKPMSQFSAAAQAIGQTSFYPGGGIGGVTLNGTDVTAQLTGGRIGAEIAVRDVTMPNYQGSLDEFAHVLATRVAAQGLQLFTNPAGGSSTIVPAPVQTGYVGYASTIAVNPVVQSKPSLVRDGTSSVAGSPGGASAFTPNPAGGPAGFATLIARVLTFALGAEAQPGVAQAAPATAGLGPAGTAAAPFLAPADLATFASDIVSSQSADVADLKGAITRESGVQTALTAQLSSSSAVNVDTEMSHMLELQNAYGANARIVAAVQTMWNQLLATVT